MSPSRRRTAVDGVVGSETYALLFSGKPKSAPKSSSSPVLPARKPNRTTWWTWAQSDIAIIPKPSAGELSGHAL